MKNKNLKEQNEDVDTITLDVPLFIRMLEYAKEDAKTDMELHTATEKILELLKKNNKLSMDNYNNIIGKKKQDTNEMTDAGSSGSFDSPISKTILKKDLYKPKEQDVNEITGSGSSGSFDVPAFGKTTKGGRKNPLGIDGEKSIMRSRAVTDKNFPKYGGPGGKFVTINPKCKKYPYCNQGDPNAIKLHENKELMESIKNVSKKYGIPVKEMEQIVINEIKQIFI